MSCMCVWGVGGPQYSFGSDLGGISWVENIVMVPWAGAGTSRRWEVLLLLLEAVWGLSPGAPGNVWGEPPRCPCCWVTRAHPPECFP